MAYDFTKYTTPMSMAIDPNVVESKMTEITTSLSAWVNEVNNVIEEERTVGGLSVEALDFGGITPLNTEGATIISSLNELLQAAEDIKGKLVAEATNKRKEELQALKQAIDTHIEELYAELEALKANNSRGENNAAISQKTTTISVWETASDDVAKALSTL